MTQIDIARMLASKAGLLLLKKDKDSCIQAVLLFQAAMEAIINEEIMNHPLLESIRLEQEALNTRLKSLSFKNKWKKSFDILHIRESDNLDAYLKFYSTYRVPITHPKSRYVSIEKYRYHDIYEGIENGWLACQLLYAIIGKELTSWEEFCTEISLPIE